MINAAGMEQGSEAWHKWRKEGLGASDVAALCWLDPELVKFASPYRTPIRLFEEKVGIAEGFKGNWATDRGNALEDAARASFELSADVPDPSFPPALLQHPTHPFLRCSLDGFHPRLRRPLEIKCLGKADHDLAKDGKVPLKYVAQVQYQLAICYANYGTVEGYYYSFDGENGVTVIVRADPLLQAKLIGLAVDFWNNHVLTQTPPPLTDRDARQVTDPEEALLFKQWREAKAEKDRAADHEDACRQAIIEKFKQVPKVECDGVVFTRIVRKGSIDYAQFAKVQGVDVEPYRKPPTVVMDLRLKSKGSTR